jgi:hypothetical protein
MKNFMTIVVTTAVLLGGGAMARAQDEGTGEVSGEASAEVNANAEANANVNTNVAAEGSVAGGPGEPNGPLGVGAAITLTGIGGLEVTYHLNPKLMLNGMLEFVTFSQDNEPSVTTIGLAASAFFNLFDQGWVDLYAGGRLGYLSSTTSQDVGGMTFEQTSSEFDIDLPLRIQIQLHRRVAIHFETGIGFQFQSDEAPGGGTASQTVITIGATQLFATGGFTIYL